MDPERRARIMVTVQGPQRALREAAAEMYRCEFKGPMWLYWASVYSHISLLALEARRVSA